MERGRKIARERDEGVRATRAFPRSSGWAFRGIRETRRILLIMVTGSGRLNRGKTGNDRGWYVEEKKERSPREEIAREKNERSGAGTKRQTERRKGEKSGRVSRRQRGNKSWSCRHAIRQFVKYRYITLSRCQKTIERTANYKLRRVYHQFHAWNLHWSKPLEEFL